MERLKIWNTEFNIIGFIGFKIMYPYNIKHFHLFKTYNLQK